MNFQLFYSILYCKSHIIIIVITKKKKKKKKKKKNFYNTL